MADPSPVDLGIDGIVDAVRVGQGSYGVVYRASQPAYGRNVAVKVLNVSLTDDESRRRFERECRALGSLSGHPNIVTLYGSGTTDKGYPYLVMDYLAGGSLAGRVAGGPLGWQEVADIGVKIAGALAKAHEQGVLHRDIKPENVLVSAYGEPQLGDFGVAKIEGSVSTTSGAITGSLAHAAPEVISGVAASAASDIWSLASTLATLLAGHSPFHRDGEESLHPLIARILSQPPENLRSWGVPDQLSAVIEAGLAKDSWDRPQTASAFGALLQDAQRALGLVPTAMMAASPAVVPASSTPSPTSPAPPTPTPTPAEAQTRRRTSPTAAATEAALLPTNPEAGPGRLQPPPLQPPPLRPDTSSGGAEVRRGSAPVANVSSFFDDDDRRATSASPRSPTDNVVANDTTATAVPLIRAPRFAGTRRPIAAVVVVTAAILVIGTFVALIGRGAATATAVPGVVGKDVAAATAALRRAGFTVQTDYRPAANEPRGTVLAQDPAPGDSAKKGAVVRLTVSANPNKIAVPDVVNLGRDQAVAAIQGAGLVANVVEQVNGTAAAGTVLLQSPDAMTAVDKGSTVTITVSAGATSTSSISASTTVGGPPSVPKTTLPAIVAPTTAIRPTVPTTRNTLPTPPIPTGNLVVNPGAEASPASSPFTVGQAPAGWQRGTGQAIAVAYGATGHRPGCFDVGYPPVSEMQGSGAQMFTGGFDSSGGCGLSPGTTPTLFQVITLAPYLGRTNGLRWSTSVLLASYPASGDAAELTVEFLDGSGQVLTSATTGPVSNAGETDFAFRTKVLQGQLAAGVASVRLTLSFPVSAAYSGGFADDVSFRLG